MSKGRCIKGVSPALRRPKPPFLHHMKCPDRHPTTHLPKEGGGACVLLSPTDNTVCTTGTLSHAHHTASVSGGRVLSRTTTIHNSIPMRKTRSRRTQVPMRNIPKSHCESSLLGSYSPNTRNSQRWTNPSPDNTAHYVASPRSLAGTSHSHQPNQQIDPDAVFSRQMLSTQAHRAAPVERGTRATYTEEVDSCTTAQAALLCPAWHASPHLNVCPNLQHGRSKRPPTQGSA